MGARSKPTVKCPKCGHIWTARKNRTSNLFCCPFCVTPETIVSGDFKPISDYAIGDNVIGGEKVKRVFRRPFKGNLISIKAVGLAPIKLTEEHPILVVTAQQKCRSLNKCHKSFSNIYFKPASMVKIAPPRHTAIDGDYLVVPRIKGVNKIQTLDILKFTNNHGRNAIIGRKLPSSFPLTRGTSWLLGIYTAEGTASPKGLGFHLGKHEPKLCKKIIRIAKNLGYSPCIVETATTLSVHIPSRILSRAFAVWIGKGATKKTVPNFLLEHQDVNIIDAYLRGCIDGDGYIDKQRWICISTVSYALAFALQLLFIKRGYVARLYKSGKDQDSLILGRKVHIHQIYRIFAKKLNPNKNIIVGKTYSLHPIRSIKHNFYHGEVWNLETKKGIFLANNILVHNCRHFWRRTGNIFGINVTSRYKTGEYYCINCHWVTKIFLDKGRAPRCAKCGERVRTGPRQTRSDAEKQRKWRLTQ